MADPYIDNLTRRIEAAKAALAKATEPFDRAHLASLIERLRATYRATTGTSYREGG